MVTTRSKRTYKHQHQQEEEQHGPTSSSESDRQNWKLIYNALIQILRKRKTQVESLHQERSFLQDCIKNQHLSWNSDVTLLLDQISELKRRLEGRELEKRVETAKANLIVGSTKRDAFLSKHKLEQAQSELDDFKAWFDILSHRCPDKENISLDSVYEILKMKGVEDSSPNNASAQHCKMLEEEVAKLKREYEKLSVKYSSEVSALRAEIKFAWNQYKTMEGKYANQVQTKDDEVNQANDKVMKLLDRLEQLQSANSEKDETVVNLRAKVVKLEGEARQKDEEISRFLKGSELLRSESSSGMPSLKRCSGEPSSSGSKCRRNGSHKGNSDMEKESSSAQLEATVATLRAQLHKLEAEANHKNVEVAMLSEELNSLRSKAAGNTPVLGRCTSEPSSSSLQGKGSAGIRGATNPNTDTSSARLVSAKGVRRSKRKHDDVVSIEDTSLTPRLFTSQFKIPKLKTQSPHGR